MWDTSTRASYLGNKLIIGRQSSGKTMSLLYALTDMPTRVNNKQLRVTQTKRLVIDTSRRCEAGCMFLPMDEEHPLYLKLIAQGRKPKGFLVQILKPLTIAEGQYDIRGRQPGVYEMDILCARCTGSGKVTNHRTKAIEDCPRCKGERVIHNIKPLVQPFTFAIDELQLQEWYILLGIGANGGMQDLHEQVILHEAEEGTLASRTVIELGAVAEEITSDRRSLPGLQAAYKALHSSGLVMPKHPYGEGPNAPATPWLDMKAILNDTDRITVFHIPYSALNPSRQASVLNVILKQIARAKNFEQGRIQHPIFIAIPEIANLVRKVMDKDTKDYMEPLKRTTLQMFREGVGDGISVWCDTQVIKSKEGPDPLVLESAQGLVMFAIGKATIKEIMSARSITNRWTFDDAALGQLSKVQGRFLLINPQSTWAEAKAGAIPRWFYPRVKLGRDILEFGPNELFERKLYSPSVHPERFFEPESYYRVTEEVLKLGRKRADDMKAALYAKRHRKADDEDGEPIVKYGGMLLKRVRILVESHQDEAAHSYYTAELAEEIKATLSEKNQVSDANKFGEELIKKRLAYPMSDGRKKIWVVQLDPCRNVLEGKPLEDPRPKSKAKAGAKNEMEKLIEDMKAALILGDGNELMKLTVKVGELGVSIESRKDPEAESMRKAWAEFGNSPVSRDVAERIKFEKADEPDPKADEDGADEP